MNHCQDEMKKAVKAGYWNLFSFNPALKAEGKNPFTLTSKEGDGLMIRISLTMRHVIHVLLSHSQKEQKDSLLSLRKLLMRDISIYSSLLIYTSNCKLNT